MGTSPTRRGDLLRPSNPPAKRLRRRRRRLCPRRGVSVSVSKDTQVNTPTSLVSSIHVEKDSTLGLLPSVLSLIGCRRDPGPPPRMCPRVLTPTPDKFEVRGPGRTLGGRVLSGVRPPNRRGLDETPDNRLSSDHEDTCPQCRFGSPASWKL